MLQNIDGKVISPRGRSNFFDYILFLLVAGTACGNIGGAFQFDRILAILLLPFLMNNVGKCFYLRAILQTLLCVYFYIVVSLVWTPDRQEGVKEIVYYFVHFSLFIELVVFSRRAQDPINNISRGWMIAVLLSSIVAYWEIVTGQHLSIAKEQGDSLNTGSEILQHMTASVTFNNYNSYVTFLCYSIPWVFYTLINRERSRIEQVIALVTVFTTSLVIIINASRGGLLNLVVMLIAYYMFSKNSRNKNIVLALLMTVFVYVLIQYGDSLTAVMAARASDGGMFSDDARHIIWTNALHTFSDTWGVGVGIGGLSLAMEKYARGGITVTHNMILEILVQYGLFVVLVVVIFLYRLFKKSLKVESRRKVVLMMSLIAMPIYIIIDSVYLLNCHLYVLMATIYIFANYERIKYSGKVLRSTT